MIDMSDPSYFCVSCGWASDGIRMIWEESTGARAKCIQCGSSKVDGSRLAVLQMVRERDEAKSLLLEILFHCEDYDLAIKARDWLEQNR